MSPDARRRPEPPVPSPEPVEGRWRRGQAQPPDSVEGRPFPLRPAPSPAPRLDLRLLPAAGAAWLVGWFAIGLPTASWGIAAGCAGVVAAALASHRAGRLRRAAGAIAVAALAAGLVASTAAIGAEHRIPPALAAALEGGRVELVATVTSLPRGDARTDRLRATVTAIDGAPVEAPVLLFLPAGDGEPPEIGTAVEVRATMQAVGPGDRVVALAFARDPPAIAGPPHPLLAGGNALRQSFVDAATALPAPGGALVPGLAVGDERLVDAELDEAMKAASLTHLTAVSGSNIALIVALVIGAGRLAGWPRAVRLAAAGLALAGFVLLVTPQGSVIRAAAMAVLVLALDASSRPIAGVPTLALAVIVLLAADPWLARDYGFALSTAATAGLLLGTRPVAARLERWLPRPVALLVAVPFVAQLACQPILLLLEPSLPLYGVVANLLAAPAAPLATVVGLAAGVVGAVSEPLGAALAWVAWLPAQWIGLIARTVVELPFALVPWPGGGPGALAFIALCTAGAIVAVRGGGRRFRMLRGAVAWLLAAALVVATGAVAWRAAERVRGLPPDWRIVACDVGQGDALLLRGGGANVLVDTGDDAALLHECLREFGVARIDLLVLSHFDADHSGAVAELRVPVGAAWLPDTREARDDPAGLRLAAAGVPIRFGAAGDALAIGDMTLHALSPRRGADGAPASGDGNDASLVVLAAPERECRSSCLRVLLLGDAGESAQRRILRSGAEVRAHVVKVSHHGSADQSAELYAAVGAAIGLYSVGDNSYGHPSEASMAQLAAAGTPWLRTDEQGHLAVFVVDGEVAAWTAR
ncbi:MAG: DUF4131 domain-containing protein [Microbacteriaceae bacterium]|nr:DUF4131 domain-containing protein [Microbacteriaceae bacterium]